MLWLNRALVCLHDGTLLYKQKGIIMSSKEEKQAPTAARPTVSYWEDPVYPYLVRCHHAAVDRGDEVEAAHFEELMQELINESMQDEQYWQLDVEEKLDRKQRKQERKQQGKQQRKSAPILSALVDEAPALTITNLKKRIFNPAVSRENVIKALEALPPGERKATIAGLPPGLIRKLGSYLKSGGR
jgi:hypothetical protein